MGGGGGVVGGSVASRIGVGSTANHFCFITLGQTLTYRPMHDVRASYVTESLSSVNIWQNPACRR